MKIPTWMKVLWSVVVVAIAIYQVAPFVRWRSQLYHPTSEGFLIVALVAVMLIGVFVTSRDNPAPQGATHSVRWVSRFPRALLAAVLLTALIPPVFHFAAKRFDPYKLAIQTARQNRDCIDVLGSPITDSWFFDGKEKLGDPATAQLLIPVRGSARAGNLRVEAVKENGRWRLTHLTLEVANPDQHIDLLGQKPI